MWLWFDLVISPALRLAQRFFDCLVEKRWNQHVIHLATWTTGLGLGLWWDSWPPLSEEENTLHAQTLKFQQNKQSYLTHRNPNVTIMFGFPLVLGLGLGSFNKNPHVLYSYTKCIADICIKIWWFCYNVQKGCLCLHLFACEPRPPPLLPLRPHHKVKHTLLCQF